MTKNPIKTAKILMRPGVKSFESSGMRFK